jgi:hypothetical protein
MVRRASGVAAGTSGGRLPGRGLRGRHAASPWVWRQGRAAVAVGRGGGLEGVAAERGVDKGVGEGEGHAADGEMAARGVVCGTGSGAGSRRGRKTFDLIAGERGPVGQGIGSGRRHRLFLNHVLDVADGLLGRRIDVAAHHHPGQKGRGQSDDEEHKVDDELLRAHRNVVLRFAFSHPRFLCRVV